jgi:hypothetical protein
VKGEPIDDFIADDHFSTQVTAMFKGISQDG